MKPFEVRVLEFSPEIQPRSQPHELRNLLSLPLGPTFLFLFSPSINNLSAIYFHGYKYTWLQVCISKYTLMMSKSLSSLRWKLHVPRIHRFLSFNLITNIPKYVQNLTTSYAFTVISWAIIILDSDFGLSLLSRLSVSTIMPE